MQPGHRNALVLRDIRHDPVVGLARQQQIGAVRKRGERPAHLRPAFDEKIPAVTQQVQWILDLEGVVSVFRDRDDLLSRVGTVGDGGKPGRLDEANQVGRDRHSNVVSAALQLHANCGAGLNIAAGSMGGQHKFHRRNFQSPSA